MIDGRRESGRDGDIADWSAGEMSANELRDEVSRMIRNSLATGFDTPERIAEEVVEVLGDEHGPEALSQCVSALMPELLAERELQMKSWPSITDCDRLDLAFEELNAMGIMARHDWSCCGTCGPAEMPAEFDRLHGEWQGKPIIGYIFYHMQDTESAVEGDGICFGYGSTEPAETPEAYESKCLEVARHAIEVLTKHGLKVTWNGRYDRRPHVSMNWQRRAKPPRFCGERVSRVPEH